MAKSVLERRHVSFSIDEHGFRETTALEKAHIFALGDSFVFSPLVSQDKTWVKLLEQATGEPIYNLGINGNSPKQQLMLLEYLLRKKADTLQVRNLLWMIFEGNDLEDSYNTLRDSRVEPEDIFRGTIVNTVASFPGLIKKESIIYRLLLGQINIVFPGLNSKEDNPYVVDGIRLMRPVYHSAHYGYRMFLFQYIERARKPESYVLGHPNRPLLERTFKKISLLSRKYGFKVTVLIAPSAPRLYGQYYENFPAISKEPHFINLVERLARALGFDVINLYRAMQPYASEELLYWRDDTHWNESGNEVVAEVIGKERGGNQASVNAEHSLQSRAH